MQIILHHWKCSITMTVCKNQITDKGQIICTENMWLSPDSNMFGHCFYNRDLRTVGTNRHYISESKSLLPTHSREQKKMETIWFSHCLFVCACVCECGCVCECVWVWMGMRVWVCACECECVWVWLIFLPVSEVWDSLGILFCVANNLFKPPAGKNSEWPVKGDTWRTSVKDIKDIPYNICIIQNILIKILAKFK